MDIINFYYEGDDETLVVGKDSNFYLNIINDEELKDVEIKINIPEEFNYNYLKLYNQDKVDEDDNPEEISTSNYSESFSNGVLTLKIKKINYEFLLKLNVTPKTEIEQKALSAVVTCNKKSQSVSTEIVQVKAEKVDINLSTNFEDGQEVKNGDSVEYTISLKNSGTYTTARTVKVQYANEFDLSELDVKVNGNEVTEDNFLYSSKGLVSLIVDIPEKSTVEVKISAPISIESAIESKQITNSVEIEDFKKSFTYYLGSYDDNGNLIPDVIEKKYKISGTAWLDSSKEGRMDENESKISSIPVKAVDKNGNVVCNTTTSQDGTYKLENLPEGEYTVIFEYDTSKYSLTTYEGTGIEESVNSNVVKGTYEGKTVATTDTIEITDKNIANINIGLMEGSNFDLSLNKKVKQISMANTKKTQTKKYDTQLAKIDLDYKYINNTKVAIEYEITITNEGDIPGYATKIVDYLPEGFDFSTELNKDWYTSTNKNIETKALANTIINPGESKTVTLVLTKNMNENGNGIYSNTAEIAEDYNEYGQADTDSTPGNNKEGEDDQSSANVILGLKTGGPVTYITLTISIMAIICVAAYEINKRVLKF
mgnify:CR=1 FL=1